MWQKAPRHSGQGPHWPSSNVHLYQASEQEHVTEALLRAKFKVPGRQSIHISKNWGFTKFKAGEFENIVAEKQLIPNGSKVKYIPPSGHMAGLALMRALMPSPPYSCPPINPSCLSKKKRKNAFEFCHLSL